MKLIICGLMLVVAFANAAWAADSFEVINRSVMVPERGAIRNCSLVTGQGTFRFEPPRAMRQANDPKTKRISFVSEDYGTTITLQLTDLSVSLHPAQEQTLRQQMKERYPRAKLVEEFDCTTSGAAGRAFDFEQEVSGVTVRHRICVVPLGRSLPTVVFTLAAPPSKFAASHIPFMTLVDSFALQRDAAGR